MSIQQIVCEDDLTQLYNTSYNRLNVIDVFTDWCGPCRNIAPTFQQLAVNNPSNGFYKMNGESDIVEEFATHVKAYPTFLFIRNGDVVDKFVGGNSERLIAKFTEVVQKHS